MKTRLPDCHAHEPGFALTPEERRELVRRIAAEGPDAIDAFVREREAQDSLIARKVQALREELMRRAKALRERLSGDFAEREREAEAEYHRRLARLQDERAQFSASLAGMREREQARLDELLRANPHVGLALDARALARAPWWRRAWRALARVVRWLLAPLLWVLRKLFPQKRRHEKRVVMTFAAEGALARAGDLYLADASFRDTVRSRLRQAPPRERVRRMWERMLGREDYETLARRVMQQMLEEEAQRAQEEADARRRELEQALEEVERRERATDDEARRARDAMREREAQEMRALEERLRREPEEQVKEAIVDQLKASGLLRESGGALLPTIQFMDRFAALVYHDEMQGGAGGRGANVGELAEGEGIYLRGPMRSHVELSRMDIPQSLLRARSRHPRVRHLTEDDIVVHREDRAQLTHVVLVVDRSGSMEENGRMEAAKRAALALHHAVRQRDRRNVVDVLLMDTSVEPASLAEVWDAQPRAFTNTGGALRTARHLLERRRAGRGLVYLVTDGLPEAYTKDGPAVPDGHGGLAARAAREDVAGHPDKAMAFARVEARRLARTAGYDGMVMLLLEPEDERHVRAAQALAEEARGRVVPVDPQELARALLRQYEAPARAQS